MHDHESALYHFGTDHAECNVHLIRYLKKNTEDTGNKWSEEMTALLCSMNKERKAHIRQGADRFAPDVVKAFEKSYQALLSRGLEENKTPLCKKSEKTLLNRMERYDHKKYNIKTVIDKK